MPNTSQNIRVPSNTHPSHLYSDTLYPSDIEEEETFYSAQGTPISRPQSIRTTIQNFAGSYSRASILYVADAISIQDNTAEDEEHQALFKTHTSYAFQTTHRLYTLTNFFFCYLSK